MARHLAVKKLGVGEPLSHPKIGHGKPVGDTGQTIEWL